MAKYCGLLNIGSVKGGGTVGSQMVQGNRVVSSFEVPVAIQYSLQVGDTHFKKIRCCEQAMAPFVAENQGREVCIYTFKQLPKTDIMLAIASKDGPAYRMATGRFWVTLFAQALILPLLICIPLLLIPYVGWALIPVVLYFAVRNGIDFYKSFQQMKQDG